jgi:competence CoiA-like predicted nuclease
LKTPEQVEYISGKKTIVTKKHVETSTIHQSTLKEKETVVEPKIVHFARHREIKLPKPEIINQYAITAIHTSNDRRANYTPVPAYDDSNVVKAISKMERNVTRTIRDKTELNMNVTEQGIAAMYQHGANTTKYITDQTNWG